MPEVGGTRLAGSVTDKLTDVKNAIAEVQTSVLDALDELKREVQAGDQVATMLRTEAASVRKTFNEFLGNRSEEDKTQTTWRKDNAQGKTEGTV